MSIKAYMGVSKKYTPVEYIESTGTQWIDTNVLPKSNTRLVAEFSCKTDIVATNFIGWCGSSAEALACGVGYVDNVAYFRGSCSANSTYINFGNADENKHTYDISNTALKFDGTSYGTGDIGNTATGYETMYLMGRHMEWLDCSGNDVSNFTYGHIQGSKQKLYSCQIYEGSTMIRNFVPALDEANTPCLVDTVNNVFYYNKGWGAFNVGNTTGQAVSVNTDKAYNVNAIYVKPSENDTDKEVRKVYVGVNNVARQCYEPPIKYKRTIGDLINYGQKKGVAIGNYFVLATGYTVTTAQAISKNYVVSTITSTSVVRYWAGGAQGTKYAFYGGGYDGSSYKKTVDTYNASLVRSTASDLASARATIGASAVGVYSIFAGGDTSGSVVDAYNNNTLARSAPTSLSNTRKEINGACNKTYAVFGGGSSRTTVDAYNSSLTRTQATALSSARRSPQGGMINQEIIYAGGYSSDSAVVDCYSATLVKSTLANLSSAGMCSIVPFENEAMVILEKVLDKADVYDKNHVKRSICIPTSGIPSGGNLKPNIQTLLDHSGFVNGVNKGVWIYRK